MSGAAIATAPSGISNSGADAEDLFCELTGAVKAERAALGDAVLDGSYIEIKKTSTPTLNQVRAVKYLPIVVYHQREDSWHVIPAHRVVQGCAARSRGQHTENPFESSVLNLNAFTDCLVEDPTQLRERVLRAIEQSQFYPELQDAMAGVLEQSKALAQSSLAQTQDLLEDLGLDD